MICDMKRKSRIIFGDELRHVVRLLIELPGLGETEHEAIETLVPTFIALVGKQKSARQIFVAHTNPQISVWDPQDRVCW